MRTLVVLLVCLLVACAVEGKSKVAERLKEKETATAAVAATAEATTTTTTEATATDKATQDNTVVATPLSGGAGGDCNCAAGADSSSCGGGCGGSVSYVSSVGGAAGGGDFSSWKDMKEKELSNLGPRPRVEDAMRPIDDWLNDFTKRTQLQGGLWEAARATVQPLLKRLERTQQEAIDRLKESNKAIREHVEDAATQHIYNLLRSKRALDEAEAVAQKKKDQVAEADALMKRAEEAKKSALESAKQMQENYKKEKEIADKNKPPGAKTGNTTNTIMSHIAKILSEK